MYSWEYSLSFKNVRQSTIEISGLKNIQDSQIVQFKVHTNFNAIPWRLLMVGMNLENTDKLVITGEKQLNVKIFLEPAMFCHLAILI